MKEGTFFSKWQISLDGIFNFQLHMWQAKKDGSMTADYGASTSWGDDDPSVFAVTKVGQLQGEYQICNGYGKSKATPVLRVRYHQKFSMHVMCLIHLWIAVLLFTILEGDP